MPSPVVALPWGSRSTTSTRNPSSASAAPRFTAVVVLPTPPFWFAIARTRGSVIGSAAAIGSGAGSTSSGSAAASVPGATASPSVDAAPVSVSASAGASATASSTSTINSSLDDSGWVRSSPTSGSSVMTSTAPASRSLDSAGSLDPKMRNQRRRPRRSASSDAILASRSAAGRPHGSPWHGNGSRRGSSSRRSTWNNGA